MSDAGSPSRQNPLIWIALVVVGLIVYVVTSGERSGTMTVKTVEQVTETVEQTTGAAEQGSDSGTIERSLLVPPGMRARQYIEQLRENGQPYPMAEVHDKAEKYLQEGSLADAHLLYFFAAREDHLPSIMVMAEMSDPTRFRVENSLLDDADVIQAYKWYQKAAALGHENAPARLDGLQQWAQAEAEAGNPRAKQLLLNIR